MDDRIIKSGFVSIVGLPNSGKSTFLNACINEKIAITSKKPQTTRKNLKGIYNDYDSQIIFIDTPGIHKEKNALDEYMSKSIKKSVDGIDLILVIVDLVNIKKQNIDDIKKIISQNNTKKILIINKCDVLIDIDNIENKRFVENADTKNIMCETLELFGDKNIFDSVFLISALKKIGIRDVISYIKNNLPIHERYYDDNDLTDEPMKQIIAEMIRQECLYKLNDEVPHGVHVVVEKYIEPNDDNKKIDKNILRISAVIVCEKESHKGIIIGKNGSMIKSIGTASRIAIEKWLKTKVFLELNVIVKNNWREQKSMITNYGFDVKKI